MRTGLREIVTCKSCGVVANAGVQPGHAIAAACGRSCSLTLACSPCAGDLTRGGTVEDKVNLAAFCREFKAAAAARGKNYLLTSA